jgi:hypothetical protein
MLGAAAMLGAAGTAFAAEPALDLATATTADFLALCDRDQAKCRGFIESVMEFLDTASGFNEIQSYQVCARLPLDAAGGKAVLDWIHAHPDRAAPVAADAIGAAGEILWPCR